MIPVVEIRDLRVRFHGEREVYAVNGVDLALLPGEVLGLLGESGSGKSVTLRALLRMLPPRHSNVAGSIRIAGEDVLAMDDAALERLRGGIAAMIFPRKTSDPSWHAWSSSNRLAVSAGPCCV
jgi:peptide/nickel transport system ATP-binding protein